MQIFDSFFNEIFLWHWLIICCQVVIQDRSSRINVLISKFVIVAFFVFFAFVVAVIWPIAALVYFSLFAIWITFFFCQTLYYKYTSTLFGVASSTKRKRIGVNLFSEGSPRGPADGLKRLFRICWDRCCIALFSVFHHKFCGCFIINFVRVWY